MPDDTLLDRLAAALRSALFWLSSKNPKECEQWNALLAEYDSAKAGTLEQTDDGEFICYMGAELARFECCHGKGETQHAGTPPMMWPEWICCIMAHQRKELEAKLADAEADAKALAEACQAALNDPPPVALRPGVVEKISNALAAHRTRRGGEGEGSRQDGAKLKSDSRPCPRTGGLTLTSYAERVVDNALRSARSALAEYEQLPIPSPDSPLPASPKVYDRATCEAAANALDRCGMPNAAVVVRSKAGHPLPGG